MESNLFELTPLILISGDDATRDFTLFGFDTTILGVS